MTLRDQRHVDEAVFYESKEHASENQAVALSLDAVTWIDPP